MTLQLTEDYGLVIAAAGAIGFVQLIAGSGIMGLRTKYFKKNADFHAKKEVQDMKEKHKKAFGTEMNDMGYPDMGSGLYTQQLEYSQWVEINNAQRAHYNMVESSGPVLACMLAAGLRFPKVCGALGFLYAIGRLLYVQGYTGKKGADGRMAGAASAAIAMMGLYMTALVAGLMTFVSSKV